MAYADDVTLFAKSKPTPREEAKNSLQALIDIVAKWSLVNSLTLNFVKCNVMYVSVKLRGKELTSLSPINVNSHDLTEVNMLTILSVTISNDLLWQAHAN